jgi:hypothetical protein
MMDDSTYCDWGRISVESEFGCQSVERSRLPDSFGANDDEVHPLLMRHEFLQPFPQGVAPNDFPGALFSEMWIRSRLAWVPVRSPRRWRQPGEGAQGRLRVVCQRCRWRLPAV